MLPVTHEIGAWFVLRGAQGVASSCITVGSFGQLGAHYKGHDEQCGQAMSVAISGLIAGITLGPVIAGLLDKVSAVSPFAYIAVPLLATLVLTVVHRFRKGSDTLADTKAEGSWFILIADPGVATPLAIVFLSNMAVAFLEASVGVFTRATWGFGIAACGQFWCFEAIPCCVGTFLAGYASSNSTRRHLMGAACLGMAASLSIGPKSIFAMQAASMSGFGASLGLSAALAPAVLAVAAERHGGTPAVYAMQNFGEQLAFLLGPVLGNTAYHTYGLWAASVVFAVPLCTAAVLYIYCEVMVDEKVYQCSIATKNYGATTSSSTSACHPDVESHSSPPHTLQRSPTLQKPA